MTFYVKVVFKFLKRLAGLKAITESDRLCYRSDPKQALAHGKPKRVLSEAGHSPRGVSLPVSISHNKTCGKGFALGRAPLKEFLDIKAGVMTVKVVRLFSRNGCRTHTLRAGVYLCLPARVSLFAYQCCQNVFSPLWRFL